MDYYFGDNKADKDLKPDYGPEIEIYRSMIKRGFWTVTVLAVLTSIIVSVTLSGAYTGPYQVDGLLVDLVIMVLLAIGLYKKSRVSACLLFLYYLGSKLLQFNEEGSIAVLVVGLIISFLFAQAVYGSFKYHQLMKMHDPEYRATSKLTWWLATPVHGLIGLVLLLVVALETGLLVNPYLMYGTELGESNYQKLVEHEILKPNEKVELFYSEGFFSILDGGNLLTRQRVISYERLDGELKVYSANFSDIAFVGIEKKGDDWEDSLIYLETHDGSSFYLLAPTDYQGDEILLQTIRNMALAAQSKA